MCSEQFIDLSRSASYFFFRLLILPPNSEAYMCSALPGPRECRQFYDLSRSASYFFFRLLILPPNLEAYMCSCSLFHV